MRSSPKKTTVPVHLLRSGWDCDLDQPSPHGFLRTKRFSFFKKTESTCSDTPSPNPPDDETLFTQSTHNYLTSSTAQQLCLPSPPPAIRVRDASPFAFQSLGAPPVITPAAMDVDPIISESPNSPGFPVDTWPKPPVMYYPSALPQPSTTIIPDPPRSSSPVSTRSLLGSTIIDALGAIPTYSRDAPFGASVPGVAAAQGPRGLLLHRPSTCNKGPKKSDMVYDCCVRDHLRPLNCVSTPPSTSIPTIHSWPWLPLHFRLVL